MLLICVPTVQVFSLETYQALFLSLSSTILVKVRAMGSVYHLSPEYIMLPVVESEHRKH